MHLLATISSGNAEAAEVLYLIAAILFVVVAVVEAMARAVAPALSALGLAFVAFAFLLL